jgi:hypothetical protein
MVLDTMPKLHRNFADARRDAKRGNAYVHAMYGEGKPEQVTYPEERKRAAPVRDPRRVSEAEVLKAVWKYLYHHPKVAWLTRMNSGVMTISDNQGNQRWVRFNSQHGISDLIGQLKDGRFLACEVKAPDAQLMDHQREFLNKVRLHKGVAFVARSIDDAERELR